MPPKPAAKSEETSRRILEAALELFRTAGFEKTTMRDIASRAGVATGAAYYYFDSKDAIVMAFYRNAADEMGPLLAASLEKSQGLAQRLRGLIQVKLDHFEPNRTVLRALLRGGADPDYPLSPFSQATKEIRDADIACFRAALEGTRVPRDLDPHLSLLLWFFQMGIIYFWVIDKSPGQSRTAQLLDLSVRAIVALIRLSSIPLTRPVRKAAVQLVEVIQGD